MVPIPRYLLPHRGTFALERAWRVRCALWPNSPRYSNASTGSAPSKPRVLEKPAKFYPPSHPQRLVKGRVPRQYPGPPLSEVQKAEQKTKKYPNMMPAEGTFMFWFLNNRLLHMSISMVLIIIQLSPGSAFCCLILFTDCTLLSCCNCLRGEFPPIDSIY